MKNKELALKTLGIFLLIFGIFAISYGIYRGKPSWIFWLCYIGMILIGIGCLKKDSMLIASQLNIVVVYLLFWNIDFFYRIITNTSLLGITDYFFNELLVSARIISLEHIFLLPLSFLALYLIKLERKDHWKISLIQLVIIYFISKFLTLKEYNVNCVFHSCVNFIPSEPFFPIIWFSIAIPATFLTAFLINKIHVFHKV